jgi:hypothetical protein
MARHPKRLEPPAGGALLLAAAGAFILAALLWRGRGQGPAGFIDRLPTGRPDFHAFAVHGRIDRRALHGMAEALDRAFDAQDRVDVLVDLRGYRGVTPGAAFDPLTLIADMRSLRHVRRYAVVGPPSWADALINLMDPLLPVEARTFRPEEVEQAWQWAQAREPARGEAEAVP